MDPVLSIVSIAVLACVFTTAVLHKILDYPRFVHTVAAYRLLPEALSRSASMIVIALELGGVVLLLDIERRSWGAAIIASLLVFYMTAFAINIARGRSDIDCGCTWGATAQPLSPWLLVRNTVLVLFAGVAGRDVLVRQLGFADWITAALASIGLITLYFCGEHLLANWSKLKVLRTQHE